MLIYILLAPLGAFAIGMLFGRQLGRVFPYVAAASITISTLLSIKALILLNSQSNFDLTREFYLFNWISVECLNIKWALSFNNITCVMLVVVTVISTAVYVFSLEYMKEDPHLIRYMSYLCLFTFCMLILITATNLLQMFVGWEGVGVSSYLLINFWFTRLQANKAAIKAMVVNRVGDFFILLALFIIYAIYGTLDYNILASVAWHNNPIINIFGNIEINALEIICLFILFGALGKSAQLGLHTWLPDAMEGPTPVSALIHAATMVTAGVFLIIRMSFLFECAPKASNMVTLLGATTAFFAAAIALFQNDIKKIVAYSTCSQIGYMMYICGLGGYDVGIFHLSNHAYFKALLFLGSASVIHAMSDEQDMRKMGGLKELLPFTYIIFLYASLALAGFPYLTGFYSKDIILEIAFAKYNTIGHFGFVLGILAAACTAYYSTRLIHQVFLDNPNGNKYTTFNAHEGGLFMTLPMLFLAFCSIIIGYLLKDMLIGQGTDFWKNAIVIKATNYSATDIEFIPMSIKFLPLIITLSAILFALLIYQIYRNTFFLIKQKNLFKKIYTFFNKKWFVDRLYNEFIAQNIIHQSYHLFYQHIDRGLIEFITAHRITHFINNTMSFITLNNKDQFMSNVNVVTIITIFLLTLFVSQNILF